MELITRATGIPANKISQVRKRLVDKGLISFDRQKEIILIDWRRIRIFAALEKPLRLPNNGNYYFAPIRRETTVKKTLKELGFTSAQVADLLGHADTRMVETVYARTRKQGILKHQKAVETMNAAYACGS